MQDSWHSSRYEAVTALLRREIESGELGPGSRISGERKYAERLGVSRETVRQGFRLAEEAGLIVRIPTRGTFVATRQVAQDLGEMRAFDSTVRGLNMDPAYELLAEDATTADSETAATLQIPENSEVRVIEVLGMGNGLPMAYYRSLLPSHVADRLPAQTEWKDRATYQMVAEAYGVRSLRVAQEFDAVAIRKEIAQALRVHSGAPGFKSVSTFQLPSGTPVELRTAWYPGGRYRFRITRTVDL